MFHLRLLEVCMIMFERNVHLSITSWHKQDTICDNDDLLHV